MALSYYTNLPENYAAGAVTDYSSFFRPPSPLPEMFYFHDESAFYDNGVNPIFDQTYGNYSDIFTPAGNVINPSPDFQVSSFMYQDSYSGIPFSNTSNHQQFFPVDYATLFPRVSSELLPEQSPELFQVPEPGTYSDGCVVVPPWYGSGGENGNGRVEMRKEIDGCSGGSLSAQSMAARVRRRRISEKTHELGKLIPGGHRMNTAEMFQAAFKYIKFLQAQIGVLKIMDSLPESEEVMNNGEMQALVTCTMMQEKLYMAEKCIASNTLQKASK